MEDRKKSSQNEQAISEIEEVRDEKSHTVNFKKKNFGPLDIIALGFNVCNSWLGIATSFAVVLPAGGPFTLMYGIVIALFVYGSVAISLAEMASVYPTAGGQYHFSALVAPKAIARGFSYVCGAVATLSWVALSTAATILAAQLLLALPATFVDSYEPQAWHYFMCYQAFNLLSLVYNIFLFRRTVWIQDLAFALTILTFLIITIYVLVLSPKQPSSFVWTSFQNNTGWSDGVCFLTGLVTPFFMYTALDGPLHMAEICTEPKKTVPQALVSTVVIGFFTAFVFSVAMCYSITDLDAMLNTTMPIYTLWRQATSTVVAPTVLIVSALVIIFVVTFTIQQTAAHLIMSQGRDDSVIFPQHLGKMHPTLGVPIWALLANFACVFIIGCLYLASTAAFNAIINSALILQMVSFAMPCFALMLSGRSEHVLPRTRYFRVPNAVGWLCNTISVAFAMFELIFFSFPTALPVSGSSMNYTCAILGVMAILVTANWFAHARKQYKGPIMVLLDPRHDHPSQSVIC